MATIPSLVPVVQSTFDSYPSHIKPLMLQLRALIFDVAENERIEDLEETLKWSEPAYICRSGSTLRIDWKRATPHMLNVYVNCNTRLIETFKELQLDELQFEGKRAINLPIDRPLPIDQLSLCVSVALRYHSVKHLPLLGI